MSTVQPIEYVDSKGRVCVAAVIKVGDREGLIETIFFEHPERPGAIKYVHWIPHESEDRKFRCWREKKEEQAR